MNERDYTRILVEHSKISLDRARTTHSNVSEGVRYKVKSSKKVTGKSVTEVKPNTGSGDPVGTGNPGTVPVKNLGIKKEEEKKGEVQSKETLDQAIDKTQEKKKPSVFGSENQ